MGARTQAPAALAPARGRMLRRAFGVALGTAVVAASAQVVVPVPFSPVPMTLQPLAVLAVGGLLGAAGGASALALYLGLGLLGLPVFAGGGAGLGHVLGPTGGYLLAFPAAAAVAGAVAVPGVDGRVSLLRALAGCTLGLVLIHAGGVAQLAALGLEPGSAFRVGFVPFFTGDLLKVGLAAGIIAVLGPRLRGLR
ncbi:MAG TPA: biotin transporter BioY [Gemmatimonadales bacterium]|nr:biotin transporter BioY [Gemmatimonadales bacterium]